MALEVLDSEFPQLNLLLLNLRERVRPVLRRNGHAWILVDGPIASGGIGVVKCDVVAKDDYGKVPKK